MISTTIGDEALIDGPYPAVKLYPANQSAGWTSTGHFMATRQDKLR